MMQPVARNVPGPQPTSPAGALSAQDKLGQPFDPHRYRMMFPQLWRAFLHAHFRSYTEAALWAGVTEECARKWWNVAGASQGMVVALAYRDFPSGARYHLEREAA